MRRFWTVTPDWKNEIAFIVAGGPSVLNENLETLRGRRVIVVNSSYERVPFADYLFFADTRWFEAHKKRPAFRDFAGKLVTPNLKVVDPYGRDILRLVRRVPNTNPQHGPLGPGLAVQPNAVVSNRTSLQGAMNLAFHLGSPIQVLIGADMGRAADGRTHHHLPHKWRNKPGNQTWDIQMTQLALIVKPLRERGIKVINTSPVSRIPDDWGWARIPLKDAAHLSI